MVDKKLSDKVLTRKEVIALPGELPNLWFLLEVVEEDKNGRAELMKVVGFSEDKDELREYILESDPGDKKLIFFFSDPEKECEI